jgi:hypothetical protein
MVMKSKKLKMVSFTKFSRLCDSHIQGDDKRCFCNEPSDNLNKNDRCNLANCPIYPKGDSDE